MGYKRATKIMKKILTCLLFFGISSSMLSQEKQMYCELVGTSTSLFKENVAVHIDFGQPRKLIESQIIVDELGSAIIFNSMIDALNWMGGKGWEFVQAYAVYSEVSKCHVYHYLLSKKVKDGESIDNGIHVYSKMKNPDEETKTEMAQKEENKAYVALLLKIQRLDTKYKEEISTIFPFEEILRLAQTKSVEELEILAKKHSKYFDKYEIYR